jgi:hypothetical protein
MKKDNKVIFQQKEGRLMDKDPKEITFSEKIGVMIVGFVFLLIISFFKAFVPKNRINEDYGDDEFGSCRGEVGARRYFQMKKV